MSEESIHDIILKSAHLGEEGALRSLMARPKIKAWIGGDPEREVRLKEEFHRLWLEHHGSGAATKPGDGPKAGPAAPPARAAPVAIVKRDEPKHDAPLRPEPQPEPRHEGGRVRESTPPARPVEDEVEFREEPAVADASRALKTEVRKPLKRIAPPAREAAPVKTSPERQKPAQAGVKGGRRESFMCVTCGSVSIYSEWDGDSIRVRCHACKTVYPDMLKLIPVKEVGVIELLFGPGIMGYVKAGLVALAPLGLYFLFKALR